MSATSPATATTTAEQPATDKPNQSPGETGAADEGVSIRLVLWTTVVCAVFGLAGHIAIWVGYELRLEGKRNYVPWQFCVGFSLASVGIIAFGGFYSATLRARVAITATVLLTFLLLLSFDLSIVELFRAEGNPTPSLLAADLRKYVGTVIVFYFGSEALISGSKAIGVAFGNPDNATKVLQSDRDVAKRPPTKAR